MWRNSSALLISHAAKEVALAYLVTDGRTFRADSTIIRGREFAPQVRQTNSWCRNIINFLHSILQTIDNLKHVSHFPRLVLAAIVEYLKLPKGSANLHLISQVLSERGPSVRRSPGKLLCTNCLFTWAWTLPSTKARDFPHVQANHSGVFWGPSVACLVSTQTLSYVIAVLL